MTGTSEKLNNLHLSGWATPLLARIPGTTPLFQRLSACLTAKQTVGRVHKTKRVFFEMP